MRQYFVLGLLLFAVSVCAASVTPAFTDVSKPVVIKSSHPHFQIIIKSNPTTGYKWFLKQYDRNLIKPLGYKYYPPKKATPGAGGYEIWNFKVKRHGFAVPQVTKIALIYARPWEMKSGTSQVFTIFIR